MILAPSPTPSSTAVRLRTAAELDQELRALRVQLEALERELHAAPAPRTTANAVPSDATRLEQRRRRAQSRAVAEQERGHGLENLLRAGVHHLR